MATGDRGGLGASGRAELGQDVGDVDAHRLGADEQLAADLAVAPALGDETEDLLLTGGEGDRLGGVLPRRDGPSCRPRCAARREAARPVADGRSPARRSPAAGPRWPRPRRGARRRGGSGTARPRRMCPISSKAATLARHAVDELGRGRRFDVGQPPQPQDLRLATDVPGAGLDPRGAFQGEGGGEVAVALRVAFAEGGPLGPLRTGERRTWEAIWPTRSVLSRAGAT